MRVNLLRIKLSALVLGLGIAVTSSAVVVQGEWTPGIYPNVKIDSAGRLIVVGEGFADSAQATAANNYLALIESKLPSLSAGRIPVEILTPVSITGNVGIAGSVTVQGTVQSTLVGTPTVTLAGTPSVIVSGGSVTASPVTYAYRNVTGNGTTVVKTGVGTLKHIVINTPGTLSQIAVYDSTTGSGTKIATINTVLGQNSLTYDLNFNGGLVIVASGTLAADITVVYN